MVSNTSLITQGVLRRTSGPEPCIGQLGEADERQAGHRQSSTAVSDTASRQRQKSASPWDFILTRTWSHSQLSDAVDEYGAAGGEACSVTSPGPLILTAAFGGGGGI